MKSKNIVVSLFFVLPLFSFAQSDWEKKQTLINSLDALIIKLSSQVASPSDKSFEKFTDDFKNLFLADVKIPDDISPVYFDGETQAPFKVQKRSIDDYFLRMKKLYPKTVRASVQNHVFDLKDIKNRKAKIFLKRAIWGSTAGGFYVRNDDTLAIEVVIDSAKYTAKISSIEYLGGDFRITNDKDKDFVIDKVDKCPDLPGLKEFKGCPPPERPKEYLSLNVSKSLSAGISLVSSDFSQGAYNQLITKTAKISDPEVDKATASQFGVALNFDHFFGRVRMIGVRTGLQYDFVSFDVTEEKFFAEYRSTDAAGVSYRRVVKGNQSITESEKLQLLRIPVEVILAKKFGQKLSWFIALGPVFSIKLSGTSKPNAFFDYGAIYAKTRTDLPNDKDNFSSNDIQPEWWLMTEDFVSQHGDANAYFDQRKAEGYDVDNNVSITESSTYKLKPSFSFTGEAGIQYKISSSNFLQLGIHWMNTSFSTKDAGNYKLTDKVGEYDSMINGVEKVKTNFIAIRLGFSVAIK